MKTKRKCRFIDDFQFHGELGVKGILKPLDEKRLTEKERGLNKKTHGKPVLVLPGTRGLTEKIRVMAVLDQPVMREGCPRSSAITPICDFLSKWEIVNRLVYLQITVNAASRTDSEPIRISGRYLERKESLGRLKVAYQNLRSNNLQDINRISNQSWRSLF